MYITHENRIKQAENQRLSNQMLQTQLFFLNYGRLLKTTINQSEAIVNDAIIAFIQNAKRYLSKMFYPIVTIAIFACMILFTSNTAMAIAPNAGTSGLTCVCKPCDHWFKTCTCCKSAAGDVVYGHASGPVTSLTNLAIADFGSLESLVRDNIYVGDTSNTGNGTAYLNVPITTDTITGGIVLLIEAEGVITYPISEEEWDAMFDYLSVEENYADAKALVYPNPTSSSAFVKLKDEYVATFNPTLVKVEIYKGESFMGDVTTNNPPATILIPEHYISTNGMYTVKCIVTYQNTAGISLTDEINIPFVVSK